MQVRSQVMNVHGSQLREGFKKMWMTLRGQGEASLSVTKHWLCRNTPIIFNRPDDAGAVLQNVSLLTD